VACGIWPFWVVDVVAMFINRPHLCRQRSAMDFWNCSSCPQSICLLRPEREREEERQREVDRVGIFGGFPELLLRAKQCINYAL